MNVIRLFIPGEFDNCINLLYYNNGQRQRKLLLREPKTKEEKSQEIIKTKVNYYYHVTIFYGQIWESGNYHD